MSEDKSLTNEEIDLLVKHLFEAKKTTRYRMLTANPEKTFFTLDAKKRLGDLVYVDKDCVVIASAFRPIFSDDLHAVNDIFYVSKESRSQGVGQKALNIYLDWAKKRGCRVANFIVSSGVNLEHSEQMAKQAGLERIGSYHSAILFD